jgi:hypothetical protein
MIFDSGPIDHFNTPSKALSLRYGLCHSFAVEIGLSWTLWHWNHPVLLWLSTLLPVINNSTILYMNSLIANVYQGKFDWKPTVAMFFIEDANLAFSRFPFQRNAV